MIGKKWAFFVVASLFIFMTGCGKEDNNEDGLTGAVEMDGSSTVLPIMEAVVEEYVKVEPQVRVPVGVSGTGGGFGKFIAEETDLNNASRPIEEEEAQALQAANIDYTELELAFDGLTVTVHPENDWVDRLTVAELKRIWSQDAHVETWADLRADWPDEPIAIFSPGADSGTFDYWNEVILNGEAMRRDVTMSEDDNVLIQGVAGSLHGIGYFGYAYYLLNQEQLKVVPIVNSNGEAVTPSKETIQNGTYEPLSRPLYTYVKNESVQTKPQVYDFVKFTLNNVGALAEEVGYVALTDEQYEKQLKMLGDIASH